MTCDTNNWFSGVNLTVNHPTHTHTIPNIINPYHTDNPDNVVGLYRLSGVNFVLTIAGSCIMIPGGHSHLMELLMLINQPQKWTLNGIFSVVNLLPYKWRDSMHFNLYTCGLKPKPYRNNSLKSVFKMDTIYVEIVEN